jgi:Ni/Fe-hydrogenase subunit HybB-like protein
MQASVEELLEGHPVITGENTDRSLNQSLFEHALARPTRAWWVMFGLGALGTGLLVFAAAYTFAVGIGSWGNNVPVAWGFGIINLVWWIGIGHAGTLISAILLLFQQKWRTSINRFAEAMTLFAVMCAAMFPVLHLGRPWFAYWLFPYPSTLGLWPQYKSPLVWDLFAISTYFTVSLLFWYLGLIPDLAALRESAKSRIRRVVYGIFALGWRGSARHWHHWKVGYLILAGLSTPLVLSVHSIISFDFAVSQVPGWHATIFPPYFVAGAVFSGFAMVVTLMIPARHYLGLGHVVTARHLENMNKVILVTGLMVAYGYLMEHFVAWYSGSATELFAFVNRAAGPYRAVYWTMLTCNVLVPQLFWFRWARTNLAVMWVISILINVGMWTERFIIVVTSLHRDFLPSSWAMFYPTWVDISLFLGTIGFFVMMFLLFLRFVPAVAVAEVKEMNYELRAHRGEAA